MIADGDGDYANSAGVAGCCPLPGGVSGEGATEGASCREQAGAGGGEVDGRELHDDRGFDVAGLVEEPGCGGLVTTGDGPDDAAGTVDELCVGGLDVDHEVAEGGTGADHDGGRDHVEDELGSGAGLEPGGSGEDLGTGDGCDGDVGEGGHLGAGDAGERDGEGADLLCVGEGSEDVGGAAAGGDADEGVGGEEAGAEEVARALGGGVFGLFAGAAEGGVSAGDDALDEGGRDGEGGRALAGVEDAEAAAGAGADVEEAAAGEEAGGDGVYDDGDYGELRTDGRGDGGVFVVDDGEQVEGVEGVDLFGVGVAGFGGEAGEVGHGDSLAIRESVAG